jgi:hypothetical protein
MNSREKPSRQIAVDLPLRDWLYRFLKEEEDKED